MPPEHPDSPKIKLDVATSEVPVEVVIMEAEVRVNVKYAGKYSMFLSKSILVSFLLVVHRPAYVTLQFQNKLSANRT